MTESGRLLAVSDLHVGHRQNREIVAGLRPSSPDDWLIVCGDVAEKVADIRWALALLRDRFATVLWVPGNHELWTHPKEPDWLRGARRYEHLVAVCRELGVLTPEDEFPVWHGPGGPARVAPLFLLYDYSFHAPGTSSKDASLAYARDTGVVCTDEVLLDPDPYPSREEWCWARVAESARRLDGYRSDIPFVLVNHWPLVREPTRVLRYPEFAQWCGTALTADWHLRYPTAAVVYGHLHIPKSSRYSGVRFEEVSLGYPREWRRRGLPNPLTRTILGEPT